MNIQRTQGYKECSLSASQGGVSWHTHPMVQGNKAWSKCI